MKNTLLITTGLSPQVVTESLYFFTQVKNIEISKIYIITDSTGKTVIEENLLKKELGYYNRFLVDYSISSQIEFSKKNIFLLRDENNAPLQDLKTVDNNSAAAIQIFQIIEEITKNEKIRLITSVAGGRKSLSVLVGQAMQFYARPQDLLTHVIVDDEILGCDEFYYPTPKSKIIDYKGKRIDCKDVKIYLDEIPFIRLRPILGNITNSQNIKSLDEIIKCAQDEIEELFSPLNVGVKYSNKTLRINDAQIDLPAKNLAIYSLLLNLHLQEYTEKEGIPGFISTQTFLSHNYLNKYLSIYTNIYNEKNVNVIKEKNRIQNLREREEFYTEKWFLETRSKINSILKKNLPPTLYPFLMIQSSGPRFNTTYGIPIPKTARISINQR